MEVTSKTAEDLEDATLKENLKTLEAVFFVSGRFLSMAELISFTDLNPLILKELIEKLQEKYEKQESSLELIEKIPEGHTHILSLSDDFYDYFNISESDNPLKTQEQVD